MSSDEETLNSEIGNIETRIRENWKDNPSFRNMRLLIITPTQWLRVQYGKMEHHYEAIEFARINQLTNRGQILDFFSKLEGLIDEIIQATILGLFSPKVQEFDDILENVSFASSIDILIKWNVITSDLKGKINALRGLRNKMAHSWSERDVYYGKDKNGNRISLQDNILQFREDAKYVWRGLINIYMKAEIKDLHILLSKLGDYNTVNMYNDIFREKESRGYTDINID